MEIVNKSEKLYLLRLDPEEEFITTIQNFCSEHNITVGWLQAIGSTQELELGYYDLEEKDYERRTFSEFLEILTINGNISMKEGSVFCHAHGLFGRKDMTVLGGHIFKCVTSATVEVYIYPGEGNVVRRFDDETGLHLLEEG